MDNLDYQYSHLLLLIAAQPEPVQPHSAPPMSFIVPLNINHHHFTVFMPSFLSPLYTAPMHT